MGSTNPLKELPHKGQTQFKEALKFFETREYKKGLKTTELILKKTPTHGESLSLRGLFMFNLGKKEEGYASVKEGLKQNLKSSISWHIYGLVYREDKKYTDAIRCYQQALTLDPDNIQIYRDLSVLQTQTRSFKDLVQTRELLYSNSKKDYIHSLALVIAYHLNHQYPKAIKTLDKYLDSNVIQETDKNIFSELLLYKSRLLELSGNLEEALNQLDVNFDKILDNQSLKSRQAQILLKLNRLEESQQVFLELLELNCDDINYIVGYLKSCSLDIDTDSFLFDKKSITAPIKNLNPIHSEPLIAAIVDLKSKFSDSNVITALPLYFSTGNKFRELAENVLKLYFTKGVPSLFNSLKPLYIKYSSNFDQQRGTILNEIAENFSASLKQSRKYPNSDDEQAEETYIWAEFFCIQYLDFLGKYEEALSRLEALVELDESIVEIQMFKAKIIKHMGDFSLAETTMDKVRNMELNDRFLNSKAVKYMFRNNNIKQAEDTFMLFIRKDATNKQQEMIELQINWYMIERARSHLRKRKHARALVCYQNIIAAFNEFYDDQLDFHSYSMRKGTLDSYFDMLRWGDNLYTTNSTYQSASAEFVQCLVVLHDRNMKAFANAPAKATSSTNPSGVPQNAQKNKTDAKSKSKSKPKAKPKEATTKEATVASSKAPETTSPAKAEFEDEATRSAAYTDSKNPLEFALPVLDIWSKHNANSPIILNAQFEAYIRIENSLEKALEALLAGFSSVIDPIVVVNYLRLKEIVKNSNKTATIDISPVLTKLSDYYKTEIDFTQPNSVILDQLSQSTISNRADNVLAASAGLEKLVRFDSENKVALLIQSAKMLTNLVSVANSFAPPTSQDIKLAHLVAAKEVFSKILENIPKSKSKSKARPKTETQDENNAQEEKAAPNEFSGLQEQYEKFLESAKLVYPRSKCF